MTTAVRIHEFGDSSVLTAETLDMPQPAPGEMRVRVHAAGVNPVDYKIRQGKFPPVTDEHLPYPMGREVSGVVETVGDEVQSFARGAVVHALLGSGRGGYAQHAIVRPAEASAVPEDFDHRAAASVPLAGLTAWQGLLDHGGLTEGQNVLIHGAAGGVGHFAVQIAKAFGARVIATGRATDAELLRDLGADDVIDLDSTRFEDQSGTVDLVLDLVGGEIQERSWTVLRDGGTLVSTIQEPDEDRAARAGARGVIFMVEPNGTQLEELNRLIARGEVVPHLAGTFPLDRVAEAQDRLETEHAQGKFVLDIP